MIIGGKGGKRRRVGGASCGASDETAAKNERTVDPYGQAMVIYGGTREKGWARATLHTDRRNRALAITRWPMRRPQ